MYEDVFNHINFKKIGRLFNYEGPEVEFYKLQILDGLQGFHMTLASNTSVEKK